MDTQFEQDMQKALALSMESHALEKFRQSKNSGKKIKLRQNVEMIHELGKEIPIIPNVLFISHSLSGRSDKNVMNLHSGMSFQNEFDTISHILCGQTFK